MKVREELERFGDLSLGDLIDLEVNFFPERVDSRLAVLAN